jgi:hypothetical protein
VNPPKLDSLERKWIGTRVAFGLAAIGCFFGTLSWLSAVPTLDSAEVFSALRWLIGLLATAIGCDTARPSGMKAGAFGVKAVGAEEK